MTSPQPASPLFEISELEDEYNRKSTPAAQLRAKGQKLPIPCSHVPTIDPTSRKIAEELFAKEFPRTYPRKSGEGVSLTRNPAENVPRLHVSLASKTVSDLFLPFRIGAAEATISVPADIRERHTAKPTPAPIPTSETSFEARSAQFAVKTEEKRKQDLVKKLQSELSKCTFRPKLSQSPKSRSAAQSSLVTSTSSRKLESSYSDHYRKRKSSSQANSQSPPAPRSPLSFPTADNLRVPPPNSGLSRLGERTVDCFSPQSRGYSPLSPVRVRTGFREGCDWQSLKDRTDHSKT